MVIPHGTTSIRLPCRNHIGTCARVLSSGTLDPNSSSDQPPLICSIILTNSSPSPSPIPFPHAFHVPKLALFHVLVPDPHFQTLNPKPCSVLLCITSPLFYFCFYTLVPKPMPISLDPDMLSSVLIHSELPVCSSV